MFKSVQSHRLAAPLALLAIALAGLVAATASAAGGQERLVVRGEGTVGEPSCSAGVCQAQVTDGAFRGTPVGTGAYTSSVSLRVAEGFPNGEGGVCAPIDGRLVLGAGSPDRLVLGLTGDSCQDGAGDVTMSSFTSLAHFTVRKGTGAYAGASGSGRASFAEDAADRERMTLIGSLSR